MLRYGLHGDLEVGGNLTDRTWLVARQAENLDPIRFGQGLERGFGVHSLTVHHRTLKPKLDQVST